MIVDPGMTSPSETGIVALMQMTVQPPDGAGTRRTVLQDGDKILTISRDAHGNTTIRKSMHGGPPLPIGPEDPDMTAMRGFPFGNGDIDLISARAVGIAYGFFTMCAVIIVGFPLARAFGRRIERRGSVAPLHPAATEQLQRIEQGMEAMSIEIERISESQRFLAKLQSGSSAERV